MKNINNLLLRPAQALQKSYLKVKPVREHFNLFKIALQKLLDSLNSKESEEHNKNWISDFLKEAFYTPNYAINTLERADLVIHLDKETTSAVGVLIEAKSLVNKSQMASLSNINTRALQELVLYFLRQRITNQNLEIKHLIITDGLKWFVFDAVVFEQLFVANNRTLVKQFEDFEAKRLSGNKTDFFYTDIAKPHIQSVIDKLQYVYFDLNDYKKALTDENEEEKLIEIYKLFSPQHLLKLPYVADSNSLDKKFYSELLHLIGLTETKDGAKKIITRPSIEGRYVGSLLEEAIQQLEAQDKISQLDNPQSYGANAEEQLFNIALDLCITWVNRILFSKLLEAQLLSYHRGNSNYAFLHSGKIPNFSTLQNLFFQVLAVAIAERKGVAKDIFGVVPYLNSSLFELTDLEQKTFSIGGLGTDIRLAYHSNTVLKDNQGRKRVGDSPTLAYIFDFLSAYDFGSENGNSEVQEESKTLINASVLGLIFEKINGYKDGSFFTPGFITMYMCRETIRRAVVQKFNDAKGWDCETLEDIYNKLSSKDIKEANDIVNSLTVCDPAVGSGHFLVSALNEIIAIKHELGILVDGEGKKFKDYTIEVVNDELVITDDDGRLFKYNPNNKEGQSQRVQKALFHEKQTIIENCLFGVDINPNSVKICRLRLWIELLKSAYYKNAIELETLPNIDINIKCGNSLVSRFALDADLTKALKKSTYSIDAYRLLVQSYRNAQDKKSKREFEKAISGIKDNFKKNVSPNDHLTKKLSAKVGELDDLLNQSSLFDLTAAELKKRNKERERIEKEITILSAEVEDLKNNRIYDNAFEWRFEFPEVLSDEGDFIGFDMVIGNPPYLDYRDMPTKQAEILKIYKTNEQSARPNLYQYFIEQAYNIVKYKGQVCYINPAQFLSIDAGFGIRKLIVEQAIITFIDDISNMKIFDEASTYTIIWAFRKEKNGNYPVRISKCLNANDIGKTTLSVRKNDIINNGKYLIIANINKLLIQKVEREKKRLKDIAKLTWGTSQSGYGKKKINSSDFKLLPLSQQAEYAPIIQTRDIKRLFLDWKGEYIPRAIFSDAVMLKFKQAEKIVIARMTLYLQAALDTNQYFVGKSTVLNIINSNYQNKYLLALLNSKLINFWYSNYFENTHLSGGYIRFDIPYLEQIPIAYCRDQQHYVDIVDAIIATKKQDINADISTFQQKIDALVYQLYDLTADEISVIEGAK